MRAPNKPATDPLLAALIEKLPAAGSTWGAAEREAWLKMMSMAFNVVYQGAPAEVPQFLVPATAQVDLSPSSFSLVSEGETFAKFTPHTYWIDKAGIARGPGGKQIAGSEVIGTIYDLRGEHGDLGSIQWADGKTGVSGLQLDIAAA
ncbi:MAG TPA: hypothetical protein VNH21_03075 [Steroidobacteraceae bacterium]|nr:hypothetical protein [Steroidobacteraceae bacterium]